LHCTIFELLRQASSVERVLTKWITDYRTKLLLLFHLTLCRNNLQLENTAKS